MIAVDADLQGSGDLNLIFGFKDVRSFGNDLLEGKVRAGDALKKTSFSGDCRRKPNSNLFSAVNAKFRATHGC